MKSNKLETISNIINGDKIIKAAIFSNNLMHRRKSYTALETKNLISIRTF